MTASLAEAPSPPWSVPALAERFVTLFPRLDSETRRIAKNIYRLLAGGEPVAFGNLAAAAGFAEDRVREVVEGWPGVYYEDGRIIGFWGLTPRVFSKHRLEVEGRGLYTWCAWDTLFIPKILGKIAQVESPDPMTGEAVRLTVTPDGIEGLEPADALMSMLAPAEDILDDIVAKLCHFIFFFAGRESGERWTAQNPGTFLMTLSEGFELGRLKNEARFGDSLRDVQT